MKKSIDLTKPELKALYEHAGGEEGLRRILRAFYARMAADPMIGFFFAGQDLERIAEKQKAFLLRAMGAVPFYSGKAPAQAHEHLPPILPGHFDRRLRILEAVLQEYGLGAEDIRTWIAFESAFRDGIVR